eukprot:11974842-Heterocapsa_arctica.AAC.1
MVVRRFLFGSHDVADGLWCAHCAWRFARRLHPRVAFDVQVGPEQALLPCLEGAQQWRPAAVAWVALSLIPSLQQSSGQPSH